VADDSKLPPNAARAMLIVLGAMALLALFSNVQRWRRPQLEKIVVERVPAMSPSPVPSAAP
jgi:hypothetical protein